jgi:hypothetical protein
MAKAARVWGLRSHTERNRAHKPFQTFAERRHQRRRPDVQTRYRREPGYRPADADPVDRGCLRLQGVVVERSQRDAVGGPRRGGRSVRSVSVPRISPAPARRTLCKSRGACPASTRRTRQAPRRHPAGSVSPRFALHAMIGIQLMNEHRHYRAQFSSIIAG